MVSLERNQAHFLIFFTSSVRSIAERNCENQFSFVERDSHRYSVGFKSEEPNTVYPLSYYTHVG